MQELADAKDQYLHCAAVSTVTGSADKNGQHRPLFTFFRNRDTLLEQLKLNGAAGEIGGNPGKSGKPGENSPLSNFSKLSEKGHPLEYFEIEREGPPFQISPNGVRRVPALNIFVIKREGSFGFKLS